MKSRWNKLNSLWNQEEFKFLMKLRVNHLFMEINLNFLIKLRVNKLNTLLNQDKLNLLWN